MSENGTPTNDDSSALMTAKPFWRSVKAMCYLFTLMVLVGFVSLGAPAEISKTLAEAVLWGLPTLLGAQSLQDIAVARRR